MRKNNEQSLGEVIKDLVSSYQLSEHLIFARIEQIWQEEMDPAILRRTESLILKDKKLFIRFNSAPLRAEFLYKLDELRQLFNNRLGEEYIMEVIIS